MWALRRAVPVPWEEKGPATGAATVELEGGVWDYSELEPWTGAGSGAGQLCELVADAAGGAGSSWGRAGRPRNFRTSPKL